MRTVLTTCAVLLLLATMPARASVEGRWLNADGDGWVQISLDTGAPVGRIAGSPNEQPERFDELNPDPELRSRSLLDLVILEGFEPDGDGKWKGGTIYDPNTGKTYKCKMKLVDENTLEVRGYIGFALVGRTETWTRVVSDN